jgi:energy-coupling factor transporter transmembrane protein EcfT
MLLAIIEPLLFLGVVVLTLLEDPRWIAQGIARLLRPAAKRWRLHCRNGRCR